MIRLGASNVQSVIINKFTAMETKKKYWKGLAQLKDEPVVNDLINNEFRESLPIDEFLGNKQIATTNTSRRDFLKFLGFSTAAATLCLLYTSPSPRDS